MLKRKLYLKMVILFVFTSVNLFSQQKTKRLPNIVFILSDDAGYADFGFQGGKLIPTPNIDRIAQEGVKYTNAYVTAAVCCPSRAGLLTGVNQAEFGHVYNYIQGTQYNIKKEDFGIPVNQKLVGDYLHEYGYKTAIIGKWHEGFAEKFQPKNRGFDYFWGFLWGSSPYTPGAAKGVIENGVPVPAETIPYMTDAIGDKTLEFIEKNKNQPFFTYVSFNAPHTPMQAKKELLEQYKGKFGKEGRDINAAMTHSLDENVGRILNKLKELDLLENTLVVFSNDNGGQTVGTCADNYPLRGGKGDIYEGGIRVPMAMMWKEHIKPGTVVNEPVTTLDLLPTFLAAAKAKKIPSQLKGKNLIQPIGKQSKKSKTRVQYWYLGKKGAIRQGDWKLIVQNGKDPELYNLKVDITEEHEVSKANKEKTAQLLKLYTNWSKKLPEPLWVATSDKKN